jgi:hypothetical protein
MFDPPEGWRYGFPKPIPQECLNNDELFRIYLVENKYPDHLLDLAMKHSRYWESEQEDLQG